jgi:hypothetical protein
MMETFLVCLFIQVKTARAETLTIILPFRQSTVNIGGPPGRRRKFSGNRVRNLAQRLQMRYRIGWHEIFRGAGLMERRRGALRERIRKA